MAERLPFGEIRPGARPIGSFVQPGQANIAEATRPALLDNPSGINAIQRASGGNVQGYNKFEELTTALAPFSQQLTNLAGQGMLSYAKGRIDDGYYSELKNQQARAAQSLQLQQEQGAAQAADLTSKLQKVDPPAAQLLAESNPWKAIGRRRALAQLAAGDVDNVLAADLANNGGELSAMQPGSSALMQRKARLTQQALSPYGLKGDELESQFYVVPKLNKAWDDYTGRQRTLYTQQLQISTVATTTAALGEELEKFAKNGIPWGGKIIGPGDPEFVQLAGGLLTREIDKSLTMFGGKEKAEAIKTIREQLVTTFGNVPVLSDVFGFVQGGNPGDKVRPTWGASNPLDMLELKNRGNGARVQSYELGQKSVGQQLDAAWWEKGSPGSMLPTDPGYPAALITFRNKATSMGYRDVDGYMKGRMDSQSSVVAQAYAPDPLASQDFLDQIKDLPPSAFSSPEGLNKIREQARAAARAEPTTALQAARYEELRKAIEAKQKSAEEFTPGLKQDIDRAVLQDLGLPAIKAKVDASKGKQSMMQSMLQGGVDAASATASLGNAALSAFTIRTQNLYLRNTEAAINEWREKNPGRALSPAAKNVLTSQAIADTRKSKEYAQAYTDLTGQKPGEVGAATVGTGPSQGVKPGPENRGVPKAAAAALPDSTVKAYTARPVMDGEWLYGELGNVSAGKQVSPMLYQLAKRAGTTTNRYLLEQLRFYPQLDPGGEARRYLERQVTSQRYGQTISSANYKGAVGQQQAAAPYNPLAPGSWLMNMLMPPAAAATMPPGFNGGVGPSGPGGSFEKPVSVVYERPEGQPGVDLYFPSKRFPAVLGGVVKTVSREPGYGNYAVIESVDPTSGKKVDVLYGHLADGVSVRPGQRIEAGQVIGKQGGTGNVRSADGTIASVDFFAPRPAGSRDMTPYSGFDQLRRHVVATLQRGGEGAATRRGGGLTGIATYYNGSGGSDGVAGGPTANGEIYDPKKMTAAVQWSLRGKYLNKWVQVEDLETGKRVRVWVNDVGQMGGTEKSVSQTDPRVIDLAPAAFKKLFGSTSRGVGRIRIVEG